jgi:hypothetical protein
MSTVKDVLNQSINVMQSLDLNTIASVFGQALFAKAAEVVWKRKEKSKAIVFRLGVFFYTVCSMV